MDGRKTKQYCCIVSVPFRGLGSEKRKTCKEPLDDLVQVSVPFRGLGSEKHTLIFLIYLKMKYLKVSVPFRGLGSEKLPGRQGGLL